MELQLQWFLFLGQLRSRKVRRTTPGQMQSLAAGFKLVACQWLAGWPSGQFQVSLSPKSHVDPQLLKQNGVFDLASTFGAEAPIDLFLRSNRAPGRPKHTLNRMWLRHDYYYTWPRCYGGNLAAFSNCYYYEVLYHLVVIFIALWIECFGLRGTDKEYF